MRPRSWTPRRVTLIISAFSAPLRPIFCVSAAHLKAELAVIALKRWDGSVFFDLDKAPSPLIPCGLTFDVFLCDCGVGRGAACLSAAWVSPAARGTIRVLDVHEAEVTMIRWMVLSLFLACLAFG